MNENIYTSVHIYTKNTDLMQFANTAKVQYSFSTQEALSNYYGKNREVELHLMIRYEHERGKRPKCFCKIMCPINPLPVVGEFQTPTLNVISKYLVKEGWTFKQRVFPRNYVRRDI